MNNLTLAAVIIYIGIGALVGLLGQGLLEEREIGSQEDRDIMGFLMTFLWPLYVIIFLVWQVITTLFGSRLLPNIAGFAFKTFTLFIGGVLASLTISLYFLTKKHGTSIPAHAMQTTANIPPPRTPLPKK